MSNDINNRRKGLLAAALAAGLIAGGAGIAAAATGSTHAPSQTEAEANTDEKAELFDELEEEAEWAEEFDSMTDEEKAEIVEEDTLIAAELATALDQAGIDYTTETDPITGVTWPKFDDSNEAAWDALDAAFDKLDDDDLD